MLLATLEAQERGQKIRAKLASFELDLENINISVVVVCWDFHRRISFAANLGNTEIKTTHCLRIPAMQYLHEAEHELTTYAVFVSGNIL